MTAQIDQLQVLIADIEGALNKATPQLPWVMTGAAAEYRQLLERARNYLVFLRQNSAGAAGSATTTGMLVTSVSPMVGDLAQQILLAVRQELSTQQIQADVMALQQRRDALVQEIQQLEGQRQSYLTGAVGDDRQQIIAGFLQALLLQVQGGNVSGWGELTGTESHALMAAEQSQAIQKRVDQSLMSLDNTLSLFFESIQRDIQAYQESFALGLEKMHGLGKQGEMMFADWMNLLVQRLGREFPSAYGSGYGAMVNTGVVSGGTPPWRGGVPSEVLESLSPQAQKILRQLGLAAPHGQDLAGQELKERVSAIANFSESAGSSGTDGLRSIANPDPARMPLEDLDLEDLDLSDLDLSVSEPRLEAQTGLLFDRGESAIREATSTKTSSDTTASSELRPTTLTTPEERTADAGDLSLDDLNLPGDIETDSDDRDSALAFLEQLSAALQEPLEIPAESAPPPVDKATATTSIQDAAPPLEVTTDPALDEFYQSLFGADPADTPIAIAADTQTTAPSEADLASPEEIAAAEQVLTIETGAFSLADLASELDQEPDSSALALTAIAAADISPTLTDADPLGNRSEQFSSGEMEPLSLTEPEFAGISEVDDSDMAAGAFFGEDLFGGLDDPANVTTVSSADEMPLESLFFSGDAETSEKLAAISAQAPQVSLPDDLSALADLLQDAQPVPLSSLPTEVSLPVITTDEQFSELESAFPGETGALGATGLGTIGGAEGANLQLPEDGYIPAAPDENLLVTGDDEAATGLASDDLENWLTAGSYERLSEDLSRFEAGEPPVSGLTLAEIAARLANESAAPAKAPSPALDPLGLLAEPTDWASDESSVDRSDSLQDLFGDFPTIAQDSSTRLMAAPATLDDRSTPLPKLTLIESVASPESQFEPPGDRGLTAFFADLESLPAPPPADLGQVNNLDNLFADSNPDQEGASGTLDDLFGELGGNSPQADKKKAP